MRNTFRRPAMIVIIILSFRGIMPVAGQSDAKFTIDSLKKEHVNWYNLDPKKDKIAGVSTEKAYHELLVNKTSSKIIVAVIDAGVDINHEDLQGKIWKNADEIPDNGVDDDENGYIDDVYGWNFLGNAEGENIRHENLEYTRICKKYAPLYEGLENIENLNSVQKQEYKYYLKAQKALEKESSEQSQEVYMLTIMEERIKSMTELLQKEAGTNYLSEEIVKNISSKDKDVKMAKKLMLYLYSVGYTENTIEEYREEINKYTEYKLNKDFSPRKIIGDNPDSLNDMKYGNPDVTGPDASHGTMVSGLIAAVRNNGKGINGIAENIEIMAIRTVPDGDEYDKDVAHAIRYAVDNGANIINMSFGKQFSPQKSFVDDAVRYADAHNILIIHAAGNDALNIDTTTNYPCFIYDNGAKANAYITVGASSREAGKELAASFSNYGKETVDLFAPGHNIATSYPGSKYLSASGTSFSAPIVSGVAALVWSYYPELTAIELKEILLASVKPYSKIKVLIPNEEDGPTKETIAFGELCATGGIVNVYTALKLAEERSKK